MLRGIKPADGDGRLALTVDLCEYGSECLDRIAQVFNVDRRAAITYGLEAREVALARLEFFEHFDDLGRRQECDVRDFQRLDHREQRLGFEALGVENRIGGGACHGRQRDDAAAVRHRRRMSHHVARLNIVHVGQVIHDDHAHGAVRPGRALGLAGGARGVKQPARIGDGNFGRLCQ